MGPAIASAVENSGLEVTLERFGGECCTPEIERVTELVKAAGSDVVAGIGGGKTADTAKLAAIANGARIAIVPTIASTDAPCSAIAVRYTTDGSWRWRSSWSAIPTS